MSDSNFSEQLKKELEKITRENSHLIEGGTQNIISSKIIDEFLKYSRDNISINRNVFSSLMLISNHLVIESTEHIMCGLDVDPDQHLALKLYLFIQLSSNFLDGFILGHSFSSAVEGTNVLEKQEFDALEVFRKIYIIRLNKRERELIRIIDEKTGIISKFESSYHELFSSNSNLLKELPEACKDIVINNLILIFFDGILTASIISEKPE